MPQKATLPLQRDLFLKGGAFYLSIDLKLGEDFARLKSIYREFHIRMTWTVRVPNKHEISSFEFVFSSFVRVNSVV